MAGPARWTLESRDRSGFTLIEAMVALVMTGALLAAAFGVVGASLRASRRAADLQTGAALAEEVLARAALTPAAERAPWARGSGGAYAPPLDRFTWTIRARPVLEEDSLMDVWVEVRWPGGSVVADTRVLPSPKDYAAPRFIPTSGSR